MSTKFKRSKPPQQTPKVCKKGPKAVAAAAQLWPLDELTVFAGVERHIPTKPKPFVTTFTITKGIYPNTWEGQSAPTGYRFTAHISIDQDTFLFDFQLIYLQNDNPIKQFLWTSVPIDIDEPFDSHLLTRGPPDFDGHARMMVTE